jgi:hypothetical protein
LIRSAYSKHLQDAGIPRPQAEAHAEATRDFVMQELATKADLDKLKSELTVRLGSMIGAGVAILAILQRIH